MRISFSISQPGQMQASEPVEVLPSAWRMTAVTKNPGLPFGLAAQLLCAPNSAAFARLSPQLQPDQPRLQQLQTPFSHEQSQVRITAVLLG